MRSHTRQRPNSCTALATAIVVALVCAGARAPGQGCDFIGPAWPDGEIGYRFGQAFPIEHAGTPEEQEALILCGALAWRDQTRADLTIQYEGRAEGEPRIADGVNSISWVDADGGDNFAATIWSGSGDVFETFDILFFSQTEGSDITWVGHDSPESLEVDIQGVLVHEFGHALGLGHQEQDPLATMFPSIRGRGLPLRTLAPSDVECIESLYDPGGGVLREVGVDAIAPSRSGEDGGIEVTLDGFNFTYGTDTTILFGDTAIEQRDIVVESCDRLRILDLPPHEPAVVDVILSNTLGEVVLPRAFEFTRQYSRFQRGDANVDDELDLSDGVHILSSLFLGGESLSCEAAGDSNADGILDLSDAVHVLQHLFVGGDPPPPPRDCSTPAVGEARSCDSYPPCA